MPSERRGLPLSGVAPAPCQGASGVVPCSRNSLAERNVVKGLTDTLTRFFCKRPREGVVSAYLFGSRSSSRTHRQSDVDVAVLLDWKSHSSRRDRFDERLLLSTELIAALSMNEVDLVVLNDVPPPLAAKIVTTGTLVFCSDLERDRAFVRDIQLRAADLLPFLRRARRVKLAVISR
jgi:predicted nucleotidyltransferase